MIRNPGAIFEAISYHLKSNSLIFNVSDPNDALMKKNQPADSEILQYLYHDGGVRGERIAMQFRWLLAALVFVLIVIMFLKGQTREASGR